MYALPSLLEKNTAYNPRLLSTFPITSPPPPLEVTISTDLMVLLYFIKSKSPMSLHGLDPMSLSTLFLICAGALAALGGSSSLQVSDRHLLSLFFVLDNFLSTCPEGVYLQGRQRTD